MKPDCAEDCGAYDPEHCDEEGNCDHRVASYDVPDRD